MTFGESCRDLRALSWCGEIRKSRPGHKEGISSSGEIDSLKGIHFVPNYGFYGLQTKLKPVRKRYFRSNRK